MRRILPLCNLIVALRAATAFSPAFIRTTTTQQRHHATILPPLQQSSFAADGSEYAADQSDFDDDEPPDNWNSNNNRENDNQDDDTPTVELQPVPISKNAGNRFVAVVWDRLLQKPDKDRDALDWHYDRIALTEEHVMFCRRQNLYNETFNTESMVDILWSLPMCVLIDIYESYFHVVVS